ncbi:HEPN domain-containing protein [Citrobacter freundii]|uniref:HEPN domain-containing protein n=1 Tax=Citrobacter freundii TaxID=546 RepID=UPI0039790B09
MSEYEDDYDHWIRKRQTITEQRLHPNHWFNRASDLRASAHVLWLSMQSKDLQQRMGYGGGFSLEVACNPVYHMLCGLALELILKAVIVQRTGKVSEIHDLNHLASLAAIKVNTKRKELLKFYTAAILWTGRYPVPVKCDDEKLKDYWQLASNVLTDRVKGFGSLEVRKGNGAADWENFQVIYTEFMENFDFGQ